MSPSLGAQFDPENRLILAAGGVSYGYDAGNKRIIILDKKGGLVGTLLSGQFFGMKDFAVDEKTKTIYILNGSSLLKVKF